MGFAKARSGPACNVPSSAQLSGIEYFYPWMREENWMIKDVVKPAGHRQSRISMFAVPLLSFALWSGGICVAAQAAELPAGLPRILVLATGGTIAGQADPRATGAYKSGQIMAEQLVQSVPASDCWRS